MEGGAGLGVAAWTLHYLGVLAAMLILGAALFPFYAGPTSRADIKNQFVLYAGVCFLCAIAANTLKIADLNGNFSSAFSLSDVNAFFFETAFGLVWFLRIMLSAALFGVAIRNAAPSTKGRTGTPVNDGVFAMLSAGILLTFAAAGHAGALNSLSQKLFATLSESLHLLLAGAWAGSLPLLFILLGASHRNDRIHTAQTNTLARFSVWAQPAVVTLLLAGFVTLIALRPNGAQAVAMADGASYDAVLKVKLGLVSAMVAVALINRIVLLPRLARSPKYTIAFRYALAIECLIATVVVAAGVTLSQTEP